ncbi:hypothetical protein O181_042310 [Austropuccinia psidii MF-1]|uniref:Uncharacterized protein n=1 Tax=Austropuccinia psidii MF-1 TaxID=1389203 RepID=A0A9Q3DKF2_9BASI|nr:hypothetical protein [Austropuccinia psidii MF-1]
MLTLLHHPQDMPLWPHPLQQRPHPFLSLLPPPAYHPYAYVVPSQHASNATLTSPYTSSNWPNPQCCLPSLLSCSTLKRILILPQNPQDMPPTPAPHLHAPTAPSRYVSHAGTSSLFSPLLMPLHPHLTFSTAYHPYAPILDP